MVWHGRLWPILGDAVSGRDAGRGPILVSWYGMVWYGVAWYGGPILVSRLLPPHRPRLSSCPRCYHHRHPTNPSNESLIQDLRKEVQRKRPHCPKELISDRLISLKGSLTKQFWMFFTLSKPAPCQRLHPNLQI